MKASGISPHGRKSLGEPRFEDKVTSRIELRKILISNVSGAIFKPNLHSWFLVGTGGDCSPRKQILIVMNADAALRISVKATDMLPSTSQALSSHVQSMRE